MTTYEQLRQEGEEIGLRKGEQIGASRVLIRQLSKRFPGDTAHLIPLLNRLSPEQQDELGEKMLEVRSLEEMLEWLKSVRHK
jgi:hypothetical protein